MEKLFPTPASMISKEALIALYNLVLPSKIDVFARHLVQFCIQRIPHLSHFGMLLSANSSFTASSTSSEAWGSMKRHFENPRLHAFLQHRKKCMDCISIGTIDVLRDQQNCNPSPSHHAARLPAWPCHKLHLDVPRSTRLARDICIDASPWLGFPHR